MLWIPFLISSFLVSTRHRFDNPQSVTSALASSTTSAASQGDPSAMTGRIDDEMMDRILQTAIVASKKAGDIILGNAGGAEVASRKANSRDLLTLIDPMCEQAIRDAVLAEFPEHDFLGEEDVDPGKEASAEALNSKLKKQEATDQDRWLWIVDPIDGTSNFVRDGSASCCFQSMSTAILTFLPCRFAGSRDAAVHAVRCRHVQRRSRGGRHIRLPPRRALHGNQRSRSFSERKADIGGGAERDWRCDCCHGVASYVSVTELVVMRHIP
jgi:Inositol monophosphatase family